MTVRRINGCPVNLERMTTHELFKLTEHIGRNQDQLERDLQLVNAELLRRAGLVPAS